MNRWPIIRTIRKVTPIGAAESLALERQRRVLLSGLMSVLAKVISAGTTLLSIPLTLHYLGAESFGMWITISSFMTVMSFADLGIGNGAVNQVARAYGHDDNHAIREIISSGLCALTAVALLLLTMLVIAYPHVRWASLLNVKNPTAVAEAGPAFLAVALMFIFNIPLSLFARVQAGLQQSFQTSIFQCLGSLVSLIGLLIAIWLHAPVPILVAVLAATPFISGFASAIFYLRAANAERRPSLNDVSCSIMKRILQTGGLFFALQLLSAITYTSDNIVIARALGPNAVTQYAISDKLFSQISMLMGMFLAPLWPAYGEAIARGDSAWVRRTVRHSITLAAGVSFLLSTATWLASPLIFRFWIGPAFHAPMLLLLGVGLWKVIETICLALSAFLNGAHIVKTQLLLGTLTALTSIGMKVELVGQVGVAAVPWSAITAHIIFILIPYVILFPRLPYWRAAPLMIQLKMANATNAN